MSESPKYPGCTVELNFTSPNAVAMITRVRRGLIRHLTDDGMPRAEAEMIGDAFKAEAISGDYDNVGITCQRWVTVV